MKKNLNRRELAQMLLSGTAASVALPARAASHPVHKHLASDTIFAEAEAKAAATDWKPEFLQPHQNETLVVLAERIIPGSTKAHSNRFMDLLLSAESLENQQHFLNSLAAFDGAALERFQHPFKALSETQQNELLAQASTQERSERARGAGRRGRDSREAAPPTLRDHFENLKGWIRGAYYSSEIGMRELGWTGEVSFDSFPGCEHPGGHH